MCACIIKHACTQGKNNCICEKRNDMEKLKFLFGYGHIKDVWNVYKLIQESI